MGHEVIRIDNHSERLDELKDSITPIMKMDSTYNAIQSLVKTAPKKSMLSSIFRRDFNVDIEYDVDVPLRESDIQVIADKIIDSKRFIES